ncbi:hypothetical protein CON37_31015 [Bacillus cereus]|nr:hypothetical protein CON37_31015 [Bacillus cereus]
MGVLVSGGNAASADTSFFGGVVESGTAHLNLKDSNGNPLIDDKEYYIQPYENPEAKLDIFIQQNGDIPWTTTTGHKMKVKLGGTYGPYVDLESSSVSYTPSTTLKGARGPEYNSVCIDRGPVRGLLGVKLEWRTRTQDLMLMNPYNVCSGGRYDYSWKIENSKYQNYYSINRSGGGNTSLEYRGLNDYIKLKDTPSNIRLDEISDSLQWRFVPAD